jgi:hypothetical protein
MRSTEFIKNRICAKKVDSILATFWDSDPDTLIKLGDINTSHQGNQVGRVFMIDGTRKLKLLPVGEHLRAHQVGVIEDCLTHPVNFGDWNHMCRSERIFLSRHNATFITASDVTEPTNCGADGTVRSQAASLAGNGHLLNSVQIA